MQLQSEPTEASQNQPLTREESSGSTAKIYRIQFAHKTDRYDPHERIHSVGGRGTQGSLWMLTQEEAVMAIDNGWLAFYIETDGQRQRVITAVSECGHRYLKAEIDGPQPNHLLDLPEYRWGT